jgi:hypothetical protein
MLSADTLSALASLGTFVVIGASAVAALVQLRHMRAGNQLEALLSVQRDFERPDLQTALRYIQEHLPKRLEETEYRRELEAAGFVDSAKHPELLVCDWFSQIGTLVKHRLVAEEPFMDLFARLIVFSWAHVASAVAIMRRTRGDAQYHDFEYLAVRAAHWVDAHPHGTFPRAIARESLPDRWRELDRRASEAVLTNTTAEDAS